MVCTAQHVVMSAQFTFAQGGDDIAHSRPSGSSDRHGIVLGLLSRDEGGRHVVPIEECLLQDNTANAILRAVCAAAKAANIPA